MKPTLLAVSILTVFASVSTGCVRFAKLDQSGLHYTDNELKVASSAKGRAEFVTADWQVDNWYYNNVYNVWQRKEPGRYKNEVRVDLSGNGRTEFIKQYEKDLEFLHGVTQARMQIDVAVLSKRKAHVAMDVFVDHFVDTIAGGFAWYARNRYNGKKSKTPIYASKLLAAQPFKFGDNDGIIASVELADRNQLELDPNHRSGIITLVLVRINEFVLRSEDSFRTEKNKYPAILTVWMYARPKYHRELLPDFYALTQAVRRNGKNLEVPELEVASHTSKTSAGAVGELPLESSNSPSALP